MLDVVSDSVLSLVEYGIAAKDHTVLFDIYELMVGKPHNAKVEQSDSLNQSPSSFVNKFVDDGSVPHESKELVSKLYNEPTKSTRPPTSYITVKCSQCGREVTVHPSLYVSPHSFRCDGCY